jgi:hypothetical protein
VVAGVLNYRRLHAARHADDMGFTKTDIGLIAKHAGLWPAVISGLLVGTTAVVTTCSRFLRQKNGTVWIDQGIRVTGWRTARYLVSNFA